MDCPNCGRAVGGLAMKVGVVKVTHYCCGKCGRRWRGSELVVEFCVPVIEDALARLKGRPLTKVEKAARMFLEAKLSNHAASSLEKDLALKKRRLDHWERKFLEEALGE